MGQVLHGPSRGLCSNLSHVISMLHAVCSARGIVRPGAAALEGALITPEWSQWSVGEYEQGVQLHVVAVVKSAAA